MVLLCFTLSALGCAKTTVNKQWAGAEQADWVVIDGKNNPDAIPEYAVWRQALSTLASADREGIRGITDTLRLQPEDAALVYKAAHEEVIRENSCKEQQTALLAEESALEVLRSRHEAILIACRQAVLDTRERLETALTPEGKLTLERWINERRRKMVFFMKRDEYERLTLPR